TAQTPRQSPAAPTVGRCEAHLRVNDLLKLEIQDLAVGGKALARENGRVVFVDRGLPGDHVTVRISRVKPAYAEARLETLDAPSALRGAARSPPVTTFAR